MAVEINITDVGFPKDVPALKPWEAAFEKERSYKFGFATSVIIGPGGKSPFGTSGCGHKEDYEKSISYHPDKYVKWLEETLERYQQARAIVEDKSLDDETRQAKLKEISERCLAQIKEAAACKRKEREK